MAVVEFITVRGFKSIALVENLALRSINVIIGANGSGKSNFIEIFSFLHIMRDGTLKESVARYGGASRILHFGSKETKKLQIVVSFANPDNRYQVQLEPTEDDRLLATSQSFSQWALDPRMAPSVPPISTVQDEYSDLIPKSGYTLFRENTLDSWRIYHFEDTSSSSPMKKTADVNDNRYLRPDAGNLAAFLYLLKVRHEVEYTLIKRSFQLVAPFFDDFVLEPLALNPETIRLEWKHKRSDAYFDASSLSDGSLRFLALATLLLQPTELRPSIILIDEPELGLHPYAITLLASLIKQASAQTQVIVSTQSASLLDHFEPEDVLVADLVDGATTLTRLSSEDLAAWLEDYSLGQLWEKNEIGGRPGGH